MISIEVERGGAIATVGGLRIGGGIVMNAWGQYG